MDAHLPQPLRRRLVRSGRSPEAIRIYADQNDSESLRFLVYKLRNLRGIRQEYASDANSPLLPYLVEDFVSNVQETYDNTADTAYLSVIDRARVLQREQQDFIAFAQKVVAEKRSKSLAMWQSAIAMMYYYSGQYAQADQAAEAALPLSGTPMMRTNARDVRVFTSLAHRGITDATLNAIVPDLRRWEEDTESGHGRNLHTRLVRQDLIPALEKAHRPFDALLAQRAEFYDSTLINMDSGRGYDPNMIYGSSYFDAIDRLSADSLKAYYTYLHSPAREAWQKLWKPTSFAGKEFYYDLMGTRLLRECRFAEAIPYLEKTSLTFLASQNIAIYAAMRDYKVERWYRRQPVHDYDPEMEYNIEENSKLKFCQDVLRLQSQLKAADDVALRQRIAYRLASYLAQASAAGDCWYLSRYGISALSSDVYEDDLGTDRFRGDALQQLALRYLDIAAGSTDRNLRERAPRRSRVVARRSGSHRPLRQHFAPPHLPQAVASVQSLHEVGRMARHGARLGLRQSLRHSHPFCPRQLSPSRPPAPSGKRPLQLVAALRFAHSFVLMPRCVFHL